MTIKARGLMVKYGQNIAIDKVDFNINPGEIVTIIGPNGSGKSTLIKTISRYIKPDRGEIFLNGKNIYDISTKDIAKKMAVLPQIKNVSSDIVVEDLVSYGRYPHLKFGKRLSSNDKEIVEWSIEKTGLEDFRARYVTTLSGGERQRAWIAMALAQQPQILLLDEPTTYLDISYQLEVLELIKELNRTLDLTVVMVLHDLNQAARYSHNIYVLSEGRVCQYGKPQEIMKPKLLKDVFRIQAHIYEDKINNCPYFIPEKIIDK